MDRFEDIALSLKQAEELQTILEEKMPDYVWIVHGMTPERQKIVNEYITPERAARFAEHAKIQQLDVPTAEEIYAAELNLLYVKAITLEKWDGRSIQIELHVGRELCEDDYLGAIILLEKMVPDEVTGMLQELHDRT